MSNNIPIINKDIVARLRDHDNRCDLDIEAAAVEIEMLRREIDELIQERDEARRGWAIAIAREEFEPSDDQINQDARRVESEFGWNCFNKESN